MFASPRSGKGRLPARGLRSALALSLALMVGACSAKSPAGPQVFSWLSPAPAPVPMRTVAAAPPIEIEDDGLPAQAPPSVHIRQMPDDPTAPWSRNYGGPAQTVKVRPGLAAAPPAMAAGAAWGGDGGQDSADAEAPAFASDDEGLPDVLSPEEAGIPLAPPPGRRTMRGASLTLPSARCAQTANGWLCTR